MFVYRGWLPMDMEMDPQRREATPRGETNVYGCCGNGSTRRTDNMHGVTVSYGPIIRFAGLAIIVTAGMFGWATRSMGYISMPGEPVAHKVAVADCVVRGKIAGIQAKPVPGKVWRTSAAQPQWDFTVVEVEVLEVLFGPKDVKKVRFGFIDSLAKNVQHKAIPAVGQTGCFFGVKIDKNDFDVIPRGCYHEENQPGFASDLALARRLDGLLEQPKAGLRSKDPDDRTLAAYMVLLRSQFAPFRHGESSASEPIDAELSKLTLHALAEADFHKYNKELREVMSCLAWSARHGAPPPTAVPLDCGDGKWPVAATAWLKENAETYRIQRLVKGTESRSETARP